MTIAVLPSQGDVQTGLKAFLDGVVLAGTDVFVGQDNRVPEPSNPDFVVFTPLRRERLETNIDTYADMVFTASIAGNLMTVTSIDPRFPDARLKVGSVIFGVGIPANTFVTKLGSGAASGGTAGSGTGVFTLNGTVTFLSGKLAAGTQQMLQPVEYTFQLDVHGPKSADNAHVISTTFRDEYATTAFSRIGYDMAPLYADNPRQVPFINAEKQYENRWIVEACLQVNQAVIDVPQQFFDEVVVGLIDVDSKYPA